MNLKRWWRAYVVGEALECPAEVRIYSGLARRSSPYDYPLSQPKLTLRCLLDVGHDGRHRSGRMEWEAETP